MSWLLIFLLCACVKPCLTTALNAQFGDRYDASQHLQEIQVFVEDFEAHKHDRDLDAWDLFSGQGKYTRACEQAYMTGAEFDLLHGHGSLRHAAQ